MVSNKTGAVARLLFVAVIVFSLQGCIHMVPVAALAVYNEVSAEEAESYTISSVKLQARANWRYATEKDLDTWGGFTNVSGEPDKKWMCAASGDVMSDVEYCIPKEHYARLYSSTSFKCAKGTFLRKTTLGKEHRCLPAGI